MKYITYVMALYDKKMKFRGIKVGSTTKSAKTRRTQILNHTYIPDELNFSEMLILSTQEYDTPHLMYASEALLHQAASDILQLEQHRADYFTMGYGYITNANKYKSKIMKTMIEQHEYITKFLTDF